ncbi:MAG: hypothetical protein WBP58_02360 [Chitinophagaceae bacterium]
MKSSFLILLLIIISISLAAQKSSTNRVLIFSGSSAQFNRYSARDIRGDTSLGSASDWGISTGVMFGKWKSNALLYYGVTVSYYGFSNNSGGKGNGYAVSPTLGLIKKFPITNSIYYMPSGEVYIGYYRNLAAGQGTMNSGSDAVVTGIRGYPFSVGFDATKRFAVMLTLGSVNISYSNSGYRGDPPPGSTDVRNSVFSVGGQLNSVGARLLLKI